jgi:hypothetical protein
MTEIQKSKQFKHYNLDIVSKFDIRLPAEASAQAEI